MPASAAPSPPVLWLVPAPAASPAVPGQMSTGTDGEQDGRTKRGYTEFLSLSLQGITLNSQLCYTYNADMWENRTAVKRNEGFSSWQYHHPKKNRGKKALTKPRLHTLMVIMNLTSRGLNQLSNHSGCYKGC